VTEPSADRDPDQTLPVGPEEPPDDPDQDVREGVSGREEEDAAAPGAQVPPSPADPAAILVDLDGTVVDTVEARITSWLDTFAEVGIPADREHVAGLIGSDGRRLAKEVAGIAGRELDEHRADAIDKRAGERFDALNREPRPLPGAVGLLAALEEAGLAWAIATSSRTEQVRQSIDALGLAFPVPIVDGSTVRHAKPAPDLLLLAAERLRLPARRCWYAGDSTWDMRAAKAAGMTGVGITTGAVDGGALRGAGASLVFPTLVELHVELATRGLLPG
jgi:HAD superfamily hydrolase (TIGR01509 family)